MRKHIFILGIIECSLLILTIGHSYALKSDYSINSNQLLEYIKKNHITNITKLCSNDYCNYIKSSNLTKAIETYINDYANYIKANGNEEGAIEVLAKGFPITKIITN